MPCEVGSLLLESGAVGAMPKEETPLLKVSVNATLCGGDGKRGGGTLFVVNSGLLAVAEEKNKRKYGHDRYHSTSPV